ncbi:DUF5789 family protein [Halomicrococcus gelatinilyticus]|uniref:DUF5789 family protein n=1 Tax=Halomicrococcus gelatinilyticus TaxID=1702103 RepID=UPI002E1440C8
MARAVKLRDVRSELQQLSYPVTRETAAERLDDVTLILADGERNLGDVVAKVPDEEFDSVDDLDAELHNALPREAVGEPYQSEGEG